MPMGCSEAAPQRARRRQVGEERDVKERRQGGLTGLRCWSIAGDWGLLWIQKGERRPRAGHTGS